MSARKIRVVLADDHPMCRELFSEFLSQEPDIEVVGQASDGRMALEMTRSLRPDVVVLDISMPVMNGIEAARRISAEMPDVRVIGLSMYDEPDWADAMLKAGASVYLSKDAPADEMIAAIREHFTGQD
jgi:two-component system nitrate/nitrite response regulator NarL